MEGLIAHWPLIIFGLGLAIQWGVNETRVRGLQHQINALRKQVDGHIEQSADVKGMLARLDERTAGMAERMERIENRLNGQ